MALTAAARYSQRAGASLVGQNSYIVKNSTVIYPGALVGIDPNSGYLQNWQQSSGTLRFTGLAMANPTGTATSITGSTSASPPVECAVNESGVILEAIAVTGAVQTSVGKPVFATDENTFTMTQTTNVGAVGFLKRFVSASNCDVQLWTPAEYNALESYGKV